MRKEVNIKVYKMKVKDFLKEVLDKKITENTQIRYGAGYYTFYIDNFKFINNSNGTELIISNILNDEIEVFWMNKELEKAMQIIKNIIYDSEGERVDYIDINNFILDDYCCDVFISAIETVLQALENSIPKEKVRESLEYIEDYFERLNGPDEDIEYIRNKKKELLEGK